jgi:uncharacterized phage protein (TIGR02216 family)
VGEFAAAASRLAGLTGILLGWRPEEFWTATPAELAAVLTAMAGGDEAAATASDLSRLMKMFPDERGEGPRHHSSIGPPPRAGEGCH